MHHDPATASGAARIFALCKNDATSGRSTFTASTPDDRRAQGRALAAHPTGPVALAEPGYTPPRPELEARLRPTPLLPFLAILAGCGDRSCLSGEDGCEIASPCEGLQFTCDAGSTSVMVVDSPDDLPGGLAAAGAIGDIVLANDKVQVVLEALDHPHYLGVSGGSIVDLTVAGKPADSLRHFWQATGLLPFDYVVYDRYEILDEGDVKAVQFHGTLQDRPDTPIHTRYEVRPCEPGVRVRTEIVNLEREPSSWTLLDGFYFGGRENLGFAPFPGGGFNFRTFGLGDLTEVMTPVPYVVAAMAPEPASTYTTVACNVDSLSTFITTEVTPAGLAPTLVMPRDYLVFERFIGVAEGQSVSAGADLALELRQQLFGEPYTTITGRVAIPQGDPGGIGSGLRALVTLSEGTTATPGEARVPWTMAVPAADGTFTARVPTGRHYVAEVEAFGQVVAEREIDVGDAPADLGAIDVPIVGDVSLSATIDGVDDGEQVLILVYPADDETREASRGRMLGKFEECAPLLGHPHAGSPACNRVLITEGEPVTITMVPGRYHFVATAGPFSTLGFAKEVEVAPGTGQSVDITLETLPALQPPGTLSGDFHVHGGASFDSSLNDTDRVRSFLAAKIDVIASTEHDTVSDYSGALQALGVDDELKILPGTEMTGHVLWYWNPTVTFPQVVGHWNVWPLPYDPTAPYRGAPWDEQAEPGMLLTRAESAGWDRDVGVAQLNHPIGPSSFGRDFAWVTATGIRGDEPLNDDPDSPQSLFDHLAAGAAYTNDAYDVQEVMNGTNNGNYQQYRAFWFYLLNQGVVRGGTANSDTHTLLENVVGSPRTLVWSPTSRGPDFDVATFDTSVKEGRMIGTNGPVLLVSTTDAAGVGRRPSVEAFTPGDTAALAIQVRAAPWVPVPEVRIIVNGTIKQTITDLAAARDPFATGADATAQFDRLDTSVPLAELLDGVTGDAWIVVEAGSPVPASEDLDCDGWPDTGDNNGDGAIDWRDVATATADPGGCFAVGDAGPLAPYVAPNDVNDPAWLFSAAVPLGFPLAFTNPLLLDRDGNGRFDGVN
jgi:hypothetical protein